MRQNLGEPKTSANFEEIEEDVLFSEYWDKEHPSVVYQIGTSTHNDTKSDHETANTAKLQMSDSNKQMYTKGATMIEKMGYVGIGPIGASGQGIWNPIAVQEPPKFRSKPVIGFSDKIEDNSSRKGKK